MLRSFKVVEIIGSPNRVEVGVNRSNVLVGIDLNLGGLVRIESGERATAVCLNLGRHRVIEHNKF